MAQTENLTANEKRTLLRLARQTVEAVVRGMPMPSLPDHELTEALRRPADTFVTLYRLGELRGCIGSRTGKEPLYRSVMESAQASATRDPRFPPVSGHELRDITINISILTPPRPLQVSSLEELRHALEPGVHGVILHNGDRRALYLPQVWNHFVDAPDMVAAFLSSLSRKAGDMTGTLWKDPSTRYEVFEAESFSEEDLESAE